MSEFWTTAIITLAVSQLILFALILALARQLGLILVRIGPDHAKPTDDGPPIHARLEVMEMLDIGGHRLVVGPQKYGYQLLAFIAPACSTCSSLLPGIKTLARDYADSVRVYVVSMGDHTPQDFAHAEALGPGVSYACAPRLFKALSIDGTPYALMLDHDNQVIAKGIVNNLAHLESLVALERYEMRGRTHEPTLVAAGDAVSN